MPKPDKVLRARPISEAQVAVSKLKRVLLFHPKPICEELDPQMCVCRKGERKGGKKTKVMTQCDGCLEWYHNDCAKIPDEFDAKNNDWMCEYCLDTPDREGYQRWKAGRKKPKKRHYKDTPKAQGAKLGGPELVQFSAPRAWDEKVQEIKERSRRNSIKKRKLQEAVEVMIDTGGHHLVDAEGMAGLEARPVDDALIDEMVVSGRVAIESSEDD